MSNYTIYALAESEITISNGKILDGVDQGDGSHLNGETITINSHNFEAVAISDGGTDTNFSDSDSDQVLDGTQTVFGVSYTGGTVVEAEYSLPVVDQFGNPYTVIGFNINNSSPAYGTVEGIAFLDNIPPIGSILTVGTASEGPSNTGTTSTPSDTYAEPACFVTGTLIDTVSGPVPVERLTAGIRIPTLRNGAQPLRRVVRSVHRVADLAAHPRHRPILIAKDALGPGRPDAPLQVSPQHRVLVEGWQAELLFGQTEVLVAATHLQNGQTISVAPVTGDVTYHHLVFDRHQVVRSHGVLSESFLADPVLAGAGRPTRTSQAAHRCLRRFEAPLLTFSLS